MKVAYVCADAGVPVFGTKGCSIHVQEIVRAFLHRGARVEIFAARLGGTPPRDLSGCPVYEFPLEKHASVADREAAQQRQAEKIAQYLPVSQFDVIYERYSLWSDLTQVRAAELGVPAVLEVNAPLLDEQQQHRELIDRIAGERCAVRAFENAHSIVAVSTEVASYIRRFYREQTGADLHGVQVVPNGVDIHRFQPRSQSQQPDLPISIGFVGSLKPWHGVESLIEAFEQLVRIHPSARLRLIGDGPMRDSLQESVRQQSEDAAGNIEFVGAVPPDQMPEQLARLDIAVAPYLTGDGFYFSPLKVYEYMAAGLPVVASGTGQLTDLIRSGINGLLYDPGDVRQLTRALVRLIESPELRMSLGRAARETVVTQHSWQQTLERILNHVDCPALPVS